MILRHYLVSGHVQGVGFRRFVEKQAQNYGLSGIVRNLEDGRVEFYAKGESAAMEEFERAVRIGPMHSAVRDITSRTLDKPEGVDDDWKSGLFKIGRDGAAPWIKEIAST